MKRPALKKGQSAMNYTGELEAYIDKAEAEIKDLESKLKVEKEISNTLKTRKRELEDEKSVLEEYVRISQDESKNRGQVITDLNSKLKDMTEARDRAMAYQEKLEACNKELEKERNAMKELKEEEGL